MKKCFFMQECVGCRTICCIVSYNAPKRKPLCPCIECIVKMTCLVSCREYKDFFKFVFGVDMSNNHKSRHIYQAWFTENGKSEWLVYAHDFNEGDRIGWQVNPTPLIPTYSYERKRI